MKNIPQKLDELRSLLVKNKIDAYIIPSNDPHFSEYVADRWKSREWISGFTGSAGTVVVTLYEAALWTDSRYFLQAEQQLQGSGIALMKMGLPEVPSVEQYLTKRLDAGSVVGVDGRLFSATEFEKLSENISPNKLKVAGDLIDQVWKDRPLLPAKPATLLDTSIAGLSTEQKIDLVKCYARVGKDDILIISALDEIAWLMNLRGADIDYNPVAVCYAAICYNKAKLFIAPSKLSEKDVASLNSLGVEVRSYEEFEPFVEKIDITKNVIANPRKTNILVKQLLQHRSVNTIDDPDVNGTIASLKAVKNETEIAGFRKAMEHDGVALTKFFMWLEENLAKSDVTECKVGEKLREYRAQSPDFVGESFGSIVGYKEHGAIVHYSATKETDAKISGEGFLLIDSGGQYKMGTTDITRTVHLSKPTEKEATDYTLVLKGMIALSMAVFPSGTRGSQLDILARGPMLKAGLNYGHGTGHGVGHFLNVHEGPQSIRMQENPVTLKVGMVTSNEPAIYRSGEYGIRTENLVLCVPHLTNEFGSFEKFETLTLFPIDTTPIKKELLSDEEVCWLNSYHEETYKRLLPYLSGKEATWLRLKTQPI